MHRKYNFPKKIYDNSILDFLELRKYLLIFLSIGIHTYTLDYTKIHTIYDFFYKLKKFLLPRLFSATDMKI